MASQVSRQRWNEQRRVQRALLRLECPRSPKSHNKIKKSCLYCGAEFWIFSCLQRIECCSRKCAGQLRGAKATGKLLKPIVRPCPKCGVIAEIKDSSCRKCLNARHTAIAARNRLIPDRLKRLRDNARRSAQRIQADPKRKKIRNLRQREHESRRRAQEKGTRVGRVSYKGILRKWGMICSICTREIREGELSFDHVIPLMRGGSHTEDNIRPAHLSCNKIKNRRLPEEVTWHLLI